MTDPRVSLLSTAIRDVVDFPKPGIVFKDITPVLSDAERFRDAIDLLADIVAPMRPDKLVGIDARGFIFASAVAYKLGIGLTIVRKKGKLPWRTEAVSYSLEYGESTIEIHADAVSAGDRVVLVDDLLATGGTARAAIDLINRLGGTVAGAVFLIELDFLKGRDVLPGVEIRTILNY
jgi:adenine phosphoribosyltransferase